MSSLTPHPKINYQWDPDLDLNGLGPLVRNPANPSRRTRARHRLLLEMLLQVGDSTTVRTIFAAYPYLREEYEPRVAQVEEAEAKWRDCGDED